MDKTIALNKDAIVKWLGKTPGLDQLPVSCADSADALERLRGIFEEAGVFEPGMIDGIIAKLRAYDKAKHDDMVMRDLVNYHLHCG